MTFFSLTHADCDLIFCCGFSDPRHRIVIRVRIKRKMEKVLGAFWTHLSTAFRNTLFALMQLLQYISYLPFTLAVKRPIHSLHTANGLPLMNALCVRNKIKQKQIWCCLSGDADHIAVRLKVLIRVVGLAYLYLPIFHFLLVLAHLKMNDWWNEDKNKESHLEVLRSFIELFYFVFLIYYQLIFTQKTPSAPSVCPHLYD